MSKIYIALPVMDETESLPLLMQALSEQTLQDYRLMICVNQPDHFWNDPGKRSVCENNQKTLRDLQRLNDSRITVFDRSSKGLGWQGKQTGVGWARKTIMDAIAKVAVADDIILSLDADTLFAPNYLQSVRDHFAKDSKVQALAVPYFHPLTGNEALDRSMLRYEIYMRTYAIHLFRIGSPYGFTALGSAIALRVAAYKRIGGITPKLSGEDFYFFQKLVKTAPVSLWNDEWVYPSARLSERVPFGTGPAVIKGLQGNWESYPIYPSVWFLEIKQTYDAFPELFFKNIKTPLDAFFMEKMGDLPWDKLRKNFKTQRHFVRACHEKLDGLRILQYLKERARSEKCCDSANLKQLLEELSGEFAFENDHRNWQPDFSDRLQMDEVRNYLAKVESHYRKVAGTQNW